MADNLEELERLLGRVRYTAKYGEVTAAEHSMSADMEQVAEALASLIATAREVEGLRAALQAIADGTEDLVAPFRSLPSRRMQEIARAALESKGG